MYKSHSSIKKPPVRGRLFFIFFSFTAVFLALIARLGFLQIVRADFYQEIAHKNRRAIINLEPDRGLIYDCNLSPLTLNIRKDSVYAMPNAVTDKDETAEILGGMFSLNEDTLLARLSRDAEFMWVKRKVPTEEAGRARKLDLEGIGFLKENVRVYPNGDMAAHLLGFVDIDNKGIEGLEYFYDGDLRGESGYRLATVDARRRPVLLWEEDYMPERDGLNLVLTIDAVIQHIAEESINAAYQKHRPSNASVIVMDPNTGYILAIANRPAYRPDEAGKSAPERRRNCAVTDLIEPGSSFKIVTACALIEESLIKRGEVLYCENGEYNIAGRILHDVHPYGRLTFEDVMSKSSNIGVVKAAQRLGPERMYRYIKQFGFGHKTGIDLPGEAEGIIRPVSKWSKTSMSALPIGQEVAVTPIQLACAISAIANGGLLMQPRVVKEVRDKNGVMVKEVEPQDGNRILSRKTCDDMRWILRLVVEEGTGTKARLSRYSSAGKTGTGQRVEPDGTYSHRKFNSIFIGFAPAYRPRISVAVVVVEPKGYYYGGTVAAPVFADIADKALSYLGVKPDRT